MFNIKNRLKLEGFHTFSRNRVKKAMGGVATSVIKDLQQRTIKVGEGVDDDEYLITRLDHCHPAINIVNVYGSQESRTSKDEIFESWRRLMKSVDEIMSRGESVLMIGDFNRSIGNDELGVPGNHAKVSYGGKLVRETLAEGRLVLLNSMAEGGPFTWVDPANSENMSCLDLVMCSVDLLPFVKRMLIDSERKVTPKRVVSRNKGMKFVFADHLPIIIVLEGMNVSKRTVKVETRWNLAKPGGWEAYEVLSNKVNDDMDRIIEDDSKTIDEVIKKVDKIHDKIKYKAFGKTRIKKRVEKSKQVTEGMEDTDDDPKGILARQAKKIEEEIQNIKENNSGRVNRVFRMRNVVRGSNKADQEAHAILDTESKEIIVNQETIKEKVLAYNVNNLKNNEPSENVIELVGAISKLHDYRMVEANEDSFEISETDFEEVVKKFQLKNKRGYDFLVKSGRGFQKSVFKLCKRMIQDETFPEKFVKSITSHFLFD